MNASRFLWVPLVFCSLAYGGAPRPPETITVYTSRKVPSINPIFEAYSKKTGIYIEHVNNSASTLIQKLKRQGEGGSADILITADIGNITLAASEGLFFPISSQKILDSVEPTFRGKNNEWVTLSVRARTLFYNKHKVQRADLVNYSDLSDAKWKGRLCLCTSRKDYNQSLVAALIHRLGEEKTKSVVSRWVFNLAKPVFSTDEQLLEAIDRGDCHVGIASTFDFAQLKSKGLAKNVEVFWPSKDQQGVHINISGAGLLKHSKNKKIALQFLEWLLSEEAQKMFVQLNNEYPINKNVENSPILKSWGTYSADKTPLTAIGSFHKKAVMLTDTVNYE